MDGRTLVDRSRRASQALSHGVPLREGGQDFGRRRAVVDARQDRVSSCASSWRARSWASMSMATIANASGSSSVAAAAADRLEFAPVLGVRLPARLPELGERAPGVVTESLASRSFSFIAPSSRRRSSIGCWSCERAARSHRGAVRFGTNRAYTCEQHLGRRVAELRGDPGRAPRRPPARCRRTYAASGTSCARRSRGRRQRAVPRVVPQGVRRAARPPSGPVKT